MSSATKLLVLLRSLAVDGHYRGGKKIDNEGVEVDLYTLTAEQLESINNDKFLIRPDNWPKLLEQAQKRLGVKVDPADVAKARIAELEAQLKAATAKNLDLDAQLTAANEKAGELEAQLKAKADAETKPDVGKGK